MAELRIPHTGADEPILDAIDGLRHALDDPERAVVRTLLTERLLGGGQTTMGEVLTDLERSSREARRAEVDQARAANGLPTLGAVEFEAWQRSRPPVEQRDGLGRTYQVCPIPGCRAFEVDPRTGAHVPTPEKRWHCASHRHLAEPGDLEPWRSRLVMTPGGVVDLDERDAERKRLETEAETRRRRREAERTEREHEGREIAEHEAATHERVRRETPAGFWSP